MPKVGWFTIDQPASRAVRIRVGALHLYTWNKKKSNGGLFDRVKLLKFLRCKIKTVTNFDDNFGRIRGEGRTTRTKEIKRRKRKIRIGLCIGIHDKSKSPATLK